MNQINLNHLDYLKWRQGSGATVEIYDIVVGSERREGHGREMVRILKTRVPLETKLIFAIARESNGIAKDFYTALGFRIVGRLQRFYNDDCGIENAIVFGLDL